MFSCTEFIPLYSEFFKFLEKKGGHDAVMEYWFHISDEGVGDKTNPNSLAYNCEKLGGFEGAIAYWTHAHTEEVSDLFEYVDLKKCFRITHMRHCPSRGMLNDLKHIEPYYDYCAHCNVIYERVLKNYGLVYERDNSMTYNAECRGFLYQKGNKPDIDWCNITDEEMRQMKTEDVKIADMKPEDNKYLHRDFHLLGDMALKYCADKFGYEALIEFLSEYVKNYYAPLIENIKKCGLTALKEWIEKVYEIEESSELLKCELSENSLRVTVEKSPVIEYMHSLGKEPTEYYIEETRVLYSVVASECRYEFDLEYYNEDGGTCFVLIK